MHTEYEGFFLVQGKLCVNARCPANLEIDIFCKDGFGATCLAPAEKVESVVVEKS